MSHRETETQRQRARKRGMGCGEKPGHWQLSWDEARLPGMPGASSPLRSSLQQILPCDKPHRAGPTSPELAPQWGDIVTKDPTSAFMEIITENIFCFLWDFTVSEKEHEGFGRPDSPDRPNARACVS